MANYAATVRSLSPVAYWPLDEASGTVAYDQTGAYPGTYVNNPTFGAAGPLVGDTSTAVTLGTSKYILAPNVSALHPGDIFTSVVWAKRSSTGTLMGLWDGGGTNDVSVRFDTTDQLVIRKTGVSDVWRSTAAYNDNAWHMYVATKSGSTVAFYVDGTPVAGTTTNATITAANTQPVIGANSTFSALVGSIAQVALWNRALSQAEVTLLYTAATTAATSAPTLDAASILAAITSVASGITGIRTALDFDEWPDSPAGLFKDGGAVHLTGMPGEDGTTWHYALGGPDLAIWTLRVPLYTVVNDSATANRTRAWALPYVARYPEAFRASVKLGGTVAAAVFDEDATIVRSIPGWPGWDDCYIVRHVLTVTVKGLTANVA